MDKILTAMSGGVDSAVASLILLESGAAVRGVHFVMHSADSDVPSAVSVAESLRIPLAVVDCSKEFDESVVNYFVESYLNGQTPNPCVFCNRNLKFRRLFELADANGIYTAATGHYARIERENGEYHLKKAVNAAKDQSYVLYSLKREWLPRLVFPLGGMSKDEVRIFARTHGLPNSDKPDSQDICFIPDGGYAEYIAARTGIAPKPGDFTDLAGNIIGKHAGAVNYTVGQRRGLGIGFGERAYVIKTDTAANTVTLGRDADLYSRRLRVRELNILAGDVPTSPIRVCAKVRYRMKEQPATVFPEGDGRATVEFDEPQRAFTPGQSAVFYDGDTVVGGGIII